MTETANELADIAKTLEDRWRHHAGSSVQSYLEGSMVLADAKGKLRHGRWLPWLERIGMNERAASRRMKVVQDPNIRRVLQGANRTRLSDLPTSQAALLALCGHDRETFDGLVDGGVVRPDATAREIKAALAPDGQDARPVTLEDIAGAGPYGAILADPPWLFERCGRACDCRPFERPWPDMTLDELKALPVGDMAARDCALFLWTESERVLDAFALIDAWGFDYRTTAFEYWKEGEPEPACWTRRETATCLLGIRGRPRRMDKGVPSAIIAPREPHGGKPVECNARIERLVPGPYLELFAPDERRGWAAWAP